MSNVKTAHHSPAGVVAAYARALRARLAAERAAGRYIVAALEAGRTPDFEPARSDASALVLLSRVSLRRKRDALAALRVADAARFADRKRDALAALAAVTTEHGGLI